RRSGDGPAVDRFAAGTGGERGGAGRAAGEERRGSRGGGAHAFERHAGGTRLGVRGTGIGRPGLGRRWGGGPQFRSVAEDPGVLRISSTFLNNSACENGFSRNGWPESVSPSRMTS